MPAVEIQTLRQGTSRILDLIENARQRLSFDNDDLSEAVAGSGLVRIGALLREALDLASRPPSIGASILVRAAVETWLVAASVLFEGTPALIGNELTRLRHERIVLAGVGSEARRAEASLKLDHDEAVVNEAVRALLDGAAPPSMKFEKIAARIGPLITAATGDEGDVQTIYNLLYRPLSTWNAHPHQAMAAALQGEPPERVRIATHRPWAEPHAHIAQMAMYAAVLGRWLDELAGRPHDAWDEAVDAMAPLFTPASSAGT